MSKQSIISAEQPQQDIVFHFDDEIDWSKYDIKRLVAFALFFSFLSDVTLYPAMLIDTRMKVQGSSIASPWKAYCSSLSAYRELIAREGWLGLYRGFWVSASLNPPAQVVYYGSYELMKWGFEQTYHSIDHRYPKLLPKKEILDPIMFFTFGGLAEITAALFFVPLGLICGRLQIQAQNRANSEYMYKNGRDAIKQIYKKEGLIGFYRGFSESLIRDVPASAVTWLCYESCSRYLSHYFQRRRKVWYSIAVTEHIIATISGFFAGAATAVATNPLHLACLLIQVQPQQDKVKYKHGLHALKESLRLEGISSMWKGTLARIITLAPASGFGFTLFEFSKKYSRIKE